MPTHPQDYEVDTSSALDDDWTLALPLCPLSRVATNTNQIYHNNGYKRDGHPLYETGFHIRQDDLFLYGLFSGTGSARCAKFAATAFPAEIIFGQVTPDQTSAQILRTLREAWLFVDKQYLASLNDLTIELVRMEIDSENPMFQGAADSERTNQIRKEVDSVASGEICLILGNTLFLSYIGECIAVLANSREDGQGDNHPWGVSLLTCAHNRDNDDEKLRLGEQVLIDLDIAQVHQTRFLGHPSLKNIPKLRVEPEELVIEVDPSWKFLVLSSPGVFEVIGHLNPSAKNMQELATILCEQIREEITRCRRKMALCPSFSVNATLSESCVLKEVAENVVEELARMHFRAFSDHNISNTGRPDMTLVLRIFDEELLQAEQIDASVFQGQTSPSAYTSNPASTIPSISETSSSLIIRTKEPIMAYVDFDKFIQRMAQDPEVPADWLITGVCENGLEEWTQSEDKTSTIISDEQEDAGPPTASHTMDAEPDSPMLN